MPSRMGRPSPACTHTPRSRRAPRPGGRGRSPAGVAGCVSSSATRCAPARLRTRWFRVASTAPSPAPRAAYRTAATSSPGVSQPAVRAYPPTAMTLRFTSGATAEVRALARASSPQVRRPCRSSSGRAASTRSSSRGVVPAAAMVRAPVSDSSSRPAMVPSTRWYRAVAAEASVTKARMRTASRPRPASRVTPRTGSMMTSATTLPSGGSTATMDRTTALPACPASAAWPTSRPTRSPTGCRRVARTSTANR